MDYKQLAQNILEKVGGKENIAQLTHCATRLRFVLKDTNLADTESLKQTAGVAGVVHKGGQYQVVIGSDVQSVFRPLVEIAELGEEEVVEFTQEQTILERLLATISGIFTPILPVITAAGMIKAVLSILVVFGLTTNKDQNYQILNFS